MREDQDGWMKRWNILLNLLLLVSGLLISGTAILLEWRMPHGRHGGWVTFLGWDRHDWAELHWWLGTFITVGVVLHLALHWKWIWKILARQRKGVVLAILFAATLVYGFFGFFPVHREDGGRGYESTEEH